MNTMKTNILSDFKLTVAERESAVWRRFHAHMDGQLGNLRQANDAGDIAATTFRRGEIAMAKRILALSDEVGPESRASEGYAPESQSLAGSVTGFSMEL